MQHPQNALFAEFKPGRGEEGVGRSKAAQRAKCQQGLQGLVIVLASTTGSTGTT
jgi:hypothetical protein